MFKRLIPVIFMSLIGSNSAMAATTFDVSKHGPLATLSLATGHNHRPPHRPHPHPKPLPRSPTRTQVIVGGIVTGVIVVAIVTIMLADNHAHNQEQDTTPKRATETADDEGTSEDKPPKE